MTSRPITRHHADWLSLVEVSGPFLSLPVLARALPQGLDALDPEMAATVRRAHTEWQEDPALHGQWARWVLGELLGFGPGLLVEGPAIPATLAHAVPEHGETLRPDLAVLDPGRDRAAARLLVTVWPAEQRPSLPAGAAALHAKAAIADDHTALVTSANLTGHGMNENMELGLLVRDGAVPRRLAAHFAQLMAGQVLVRVG